MEPGEATSQSVLRPQLRGLTRVGGRSAARPTQASAQPLPPLAAALARAARSQDEDAETLACLRHQKEAPADLACAVLRDWVARQPTVVASAAVTVGAAYVRVLHGTVHWGGREDDEHDGKFLAAVGDRRGGQDPPWVKVAETCFHRESHHLPEDWAKDSAIGQFFDRAESRCRLFSLGNEEKETAATAVPRCPLLPMEVAAKAAREPTTAGELFLGALRVLPGAGRGRDGSARAQHELGNPGRLPRRGGAHKRDGAQSSTRRWGGAWGRGQRRPRRRRPARRSRGKAAWREFIKPCVWRSKRWRRRKPRR